MVPRSLRRLAYPASLLALGALVACSPAAPTAAPAPPTAATGPTGKVTIAIGSQTIASMETGRATVSASLATLWPVFDGLTFIDDKGQVQPALATSWRTIDDKTWEFTLGDWTFHNGRAVTLDDVLGTFRRYSDPNERLPALALFNSVDRFDGAGKTITFTMKVVDPTFPAVIGLAMVTPMRELREQGPDDFFRKPIGSGPFRVVSTDYQVANVYEAMGPEHRSPRGRPKVKELELRFVPEASQRVAALQTGQVDMAAGIPTSAVRQLEAAGFTIVRGAGNATVSYLLDTRSGPTADRRVRLAINYAIDKQAIIDALYGGAARADSHLLGPAALGFNANLQPYPYDPARARQLLAEAGYANGFTVAMTHATTGTTPKDLAELVQGQLRDVGITANVQIRELAIWTQENNNDQKNAAIWMQVLNWDQTFEAQSVYRWFSSDFTWERGRRWDDPEFDRLYQQAKTTLDREQRARLYQQAAARLHNEAVSLFLIQPFTPSAVKKGLVFPVGGSDARYYVEMRWE